MSNLEDEKLSQGQAHAEHIITDLLEKVINELDDVLTMDKLQGDAALFYTVADDYDDISDKILKRLQTSFRVFNQRLEEIKFCESCSCGTCADIGNLKLKSFVHFGDFFIKKLTNLKKLQGKMLFWHIV